MAFAKRSGWDLLREPLLSRDKDISIVVGLNFGITDPKLLEEWVSLSGEAPSRFQVRIAPQLPTFHPKVIIARFEDRSNFAIVGSGNLTSGGQRENVECGVFLKSEAEISELEEWYKNLLSTPLTKEIIEEYRPLHERAKAVEKRALAANGLIAALNKGATTWYKDLLLAEFADFLNSVRGKNAVKDRVDGARRIRAALKMPSFDFDKTGFLDFYGIAEFGRIRQAHRDMLQRLPALRRAMLSLIVKPLDLDRFRKVFERNGKQHVAGFGINQISKVLTVYDKRKWPVLNRRAWTTLNHYGYKVPWSAAGYLEFSADMRKCLGEINHLDFWEFDAFCEVKSRDLES